MLSSPIVMRLVDFFFLLVCLSPLIERSSVCLVGYTASLSIIAAELPLLNCDQS
jgi:hypothetical protein